MEKSRIFIVSSNRAIVLAKALREIFTTDYSEVYVWNEAVKGEDLDIRIRMLEQEAENKCDFAAVIMTKDDVALRENSKKKQRQVTFNCIFEAGLLMGILGRDRCFLFSSTAPEDLPTDLQDLRLFSFSEPLDLTDYNSCVKAIKDSPAIEDILTLVECKGKFMERVRFELFSPEELWLREKPINQHGDLEPKGVVLSLLNAPPETSYNATSQIWQNLQNEVIYRYLFKADSSGVRRICMFLQMILLAPLVKKSKADDLNYRLGLIKNNQDAVLDNLRFICHKKNMKFFFFPLEATIQFVNHNANHKHNAKTYIWYDNRGFLRWATGRRAEEIWKIFQGWMPKSPLAGVFQFYFLSVLSRDEHGKKFREGFQEGLDKEIKMFFPEIHEKVKKLCYKGKL